MKTLAAILTTAAALAFTAATSFASVQNLPFKIQASGTATLRVSNTAVIEADFTGSATSSYLGTGAWNSTLNVPISSMVSMGGGLYCGMGTGSATLTAANGDLLNFDFTGTVCEQGTSLIGVPHTFTGAYTITGGTGRFADATGTGSITAGDDGAGNAYMQDAGIVRY